MSRDLLIALPLAVFASMFGWWLGHSAPAQPEPVRPMITSDKCVEQKLFLECLKALPVGPTHTVGNDWDEVVSECHRAANISSEREAQTVPPECRGRSWRQ